MPWLEFGWGDRGVLPLGADDRAPDDPARAARAVPAGQCVGAACRRAWHATPAHGLSSSAELVALRVSATTASSDLLAQLDATSSAPDGRTSCRSRSPDCMDRACSIRRSALFSVFKVCNHWIARAARRRRRCRPRRCLPRCRRDCCSTCAGAPGCGRCDRTEARRESPAPEAMAAARHAAAALSRRGRPQGLVRARFRVRSRIWRAGSI